MQWKEPTKFADGVRFSKWVDDDYFDRFSLEKETPFSCSLKTLMTIGLRKEWDWLKPWKGKM